MTYALAARLARVGARLEARGLDVYYDPGWQSRGHGVMGSIETITEHHTATSEKAAGDYPSHLTVRDGRSDLDGPLAHFGTGRTGRIYFFAAGIAYHAGVSRAAAFTNPHALGNEIENSGLRGDDYPEVQLSAAVALAYELRQEFDLSTADVRGHKETCYPVGRKPDPSFDMDTFRARVAALGAPKVSAAVREAQRTNPDRGPIGPWPWGSYKVGRDAGKSASWVDGSESTIAMKYVNAWRRELAQAGDDYFGKPNTPFDAALEARLKVWQKAVGLEPTGTISSPDHEVATRR